MARNGVTSRVQGCGTGTGAYAGSINPVINIQEKIGKTVGRRKAGGIFQCGSTKESERGLKRLFGTPNIPRGVYRFRTHEEADAWLMKMLVRQKS